MLLTRGRRTGAAGSGSRGLCPQGDPPSGAGTALGELSPQLRTLEDLQGPGQDMALKGDFRKLWKNPPHHHNVAFGA